MKRLVLGLMFIFMLASVAHAQQKNRFDVFLGGFFPQGQYEEEGIDSAAYTTGMNLGLAYTRYITQVIGIGAFVEVNYFGAEEAYAYTIDDITSLIYGLQAQLQIQIRSPASFFATAKVGQSKNTLNATVYPPSGYGSVDYSVSGSALAFMLEAGLRYTLNYSWDIGALLKYSSITQKFSGAKDSALGGIALAVQLGYKF